MKFSRASNPRAWRATVQISDDNRRCLLTKQSRSIHPEYFLSRARREVLLDPFELAIPVVRDVRKVGPIKNAVGVALEVGRRDAPLEPIAEQHGGVEVQVGALV